MVALIATCPSCNGPLRVPDELVGRRVRCPSCQTIFHAAAPAAPEPASEPERPLWKNLQLELDNGDPIRPDSAPPPQATPPRPGLTGAVEIDALQEREGASRRPAPQEVRDDDYGPSGRRPYRRRQPRRDLEPHRGALILTLGIVSLASLALDACYGLGVPIGLPLGITAWALGSGDLRRMKNNEMDAEGLGMTQAGRICGILGTILQSLILLTCGALVTTFVVLGASAPPPQTRPAPPPVLVPPRPPQAGPINES